MFIMNKYQWNKVCITIDVYCFDLNKLEGFYIQYFIERVNEPHRMQIKAGLHTTWWIEVYCVCVANVFLAIEACVLCIPVLLGSTHTSQWFFLKTVQEFVVGVVGSVGRANGAPASSSWILLTMAAEAGDLGICWGITNALPSSLRKSHFLYCFPLFQSGFNAIQMTNALHAEMSKMWKNITNGHVGFFYCRCSQSPACLNGHLWVSTAWRDSGP